MQIPSKIAFHNMDPSPALEARIQQKIDKLAQRYPTMIKCDVMVEASHHHRHKGYPYSVHIHVTLPGSEMVVSHHPGKKPIRHELAYAAMNDAFRAIEKQLAHFRQAQRGAVKGHVSVLQTGHVTRLDVGQEFGFIAMEDDTELYFHRNAVQAGRFLELEVGSKVRFSFIEGEGTQGPQANFVRLYHKKTSSS